MAALTLLRTRTIARHVRRFMACCSTLTTIRCSGLSSRTRTSCCPTRIFQSSMSCRPHWASTFRRRSATQVFVSFDTSLNSLRMLPPSAEQILFNNDHPIVKKVLSEKQAAASSAARSPMTAKAADLALKQCRQKGRAWSHLSPTSTSPWLDLLTPREQDCVAFGQREVANDGCSCHVFDYGQSLDRTPTSSRHDGDESIIVLPCILPGSRFYIDFCANAEGGKKKKACAGRMLTGPEHLLLQGWPMKGAGLTHMKKFLNDELLLKDLAGNMFSSTVCLSVMTCLIATFEWHECDELAEDVEDDDLESMLSWLGQATST